MMSKVEVNGDGQDPLFAFLQKEQPGMMSFVLGSAFSWNFAKVLVDRKGIPVERYTSMQSPEGLGDAVERLL
jgi:glutathione peroxidase